MDPILLARAQFGINIGFHILFPSITIGLGWILFYFKLRWVSSRDDKWRAAYLSWVKVFALSFALGVVSGIVMSFQFGTNWPGYMNTVGNVAGPLLGYEVLTAFFLEASFLGIMLFGWRRVPERMHTIATFLVAFGTTLSAFWILALNSWMQTPAGHVVVDGVAHVDSWAEVVFNPSFPYRFTHMLLASGLTCAFLLAGLSAYRWLRGETSAEVAATLRTGVVLAALLIPVQIAVGDLHGLNTLEHQPAKIAAIEAIWHTERGAPLLLFGWPDEASHSTRYALGIPQGASLILGHALDAELRGLDAFTARPPVLPLFWGFRIMVGIGVAMLLVSWTAAWRLRRGRPPSRGLARVLVAMTFSGWVAVLAGWIVTEVGRQPWLVYGLLPTGAAASEVPAPMIGASLGLYLSVYLLLLVAYVRVLFYLAAKGSRPLPTVPAEGH